MSSSKIRKAIGVVKDQTSISIAKVSGNVAPDLDVLIIKATGHRTEPTEEKYIREILHLISQSRGYVSACIYNISKRLSKTHDWAVALKALMLVHRLLVDGDQVFSQEIMFASRKGARVLNMSDFRVEALSNYWDHSGFVKNYGMYLDQKLELIAFERKLTPVGFRDDHGYGISHKPKYYGELDESVRTTPVRDMKPDRVLERLNILLRLINRVLSCRPAGRAKSSKMVLVALYLVLQESFRIYADICEALGVLLDRFTEMEYGNCVKTFDQYVIAAKRIDELVDFYSWSKELGVARATEFPEVQQVTDKILGTLERFLIKKKNKLKKNMEECCNENGPSPPAAVATMEDLLNLNDDRVPPADNNGNMLALALFSGPKTVESKDTWEVFECDKVAARRSSVVAGGKADWELALVESASYNLSMTHKAGPGGLDPVMLNGIYDQGTMTQHMGYNQVHAPPVLALPAPNEKAGPVVDPQDPFSASLMVPPPSYVQLADMEKKKGFLVQEQQQVWQPYGGNVGEINGGYNGMGYTYAHY